MRLLRPSFFVLLIESGVVSSCTRSNHINFQASKWGGGGRGRGRGVGCGGRGSVIGPLPPRTFDTNLSRR